MSFKQLLLVIRARWALAAGVFGAVLLLGFLYTVLSPMLYTASASVVVDTKTDPVAGVAVAAEISTGYIATQVDIITSERVAQLVAKTLKYDKDPAWIKAWQGSTGGRGNILVWLGIKLQKTLSVTPSRDSSVIDVSVTWTDPVNAAVLANAFARAYIDTTIELRVDPAKQYAAWFAERSSALRADLEAKQKRLADYEAATGIVATTEGRLDIENARLAELSSQLSAIQALRQDSQSRQRQSSGTRDALPEVLQSPLISSLKADLSRQEGKLQDIAVTLGKNHPDYQTTVAEIASTRRRIDEESGKIAAALGSTTQINLRRENDIRAALEAQKLHILELTSKHDEVTGLQNDVTTAKRNLDLVAQRLAQSSLESLTQQTNVALLTPAVEPLFRSSPRYSINILVAAFLGGLLGVAAALIREVTDRRFRDDVELSQLLGIPVLGRMPHMKPLPRNAKALRGPSFPRAEPSAI